MKIALIETAQQNQKGVVLVSLIMVLVIFAALGAAVVSTSITSAINQVWTGSTSRAYYLAESGFRYTRTEYKYTSDGEVTASANNEVRDDRNQKLINWSTIPEGSPGLFNLSNAEEKFELNIYPHFSVISNPNGYSVGANLILTQFPGEKPEGLTLPTEATPVKLEIWTDDQIYSANYSYDSATERITFSNVNPVLQANVPANMDVYWVVNPGSNQTINQGGDLTLTDAALFPDANGVFRVNTGDGTIYAYKSKAGNTLQGIFDVNNPERTLSDTVAATDNIIIYPFVELHSTGIVDHGAGAETKREITYNVPLATDENIKAEFNETFEDLSKWETPASSGSHAAGDVEGDKALKVTGTDAVGAGDAGSLIHLKWSETSVDLNTIHQRSGNFLSYDSQVKVGFDPLPIPSSYAAGISFRLDNDNNSYGLSFMRGEADPDDKIPDDIVPVNDAAMIVLWQQTVAGTTQKWLAYAEIPATVLPIDDVESGVNDWAVEGIPAPDGLWHITNSPPAGSGGSGGSAWYYGQEASGDYDTGARNRGYLISPPINLCTANSAFLNFWSWYETESEFDPFFVNTFDIKWVDVSTDNGSSWTGVFQIKHPEHPMRTWEQIAVDLSAYVGNAIRIRFRFDTFDVVANNFKGWYVDDIEVTSDAEFPLNASTLLVRVVEAASLGFTGGSDGAGTQGIEAGAIIQGGTSLNSATVIRTPIIASGSWAGDDAAGTLLLQNVTGDFQDGESLSVAGPSAAVATAADYTAKANVIRAYYGNPGTCGTPNDDPLDDNKHGNPRNAAQANWPPDEVVDWAAANDYFRLVQWEEVNTAAVSSIELIPSLDEPDAILQSTESDLLSPSVPGAFTQPELGLHTFGENATQVFFDDFALQAVLFSTGQFLSPTQQ